MRTTRRRASAVAAAALVVATALTGCLPNPFAPPAPTSTQGPGPSTSTQAPVDAETADYLTAAASGGADGAESGDAVAAGSAGVISVTDTAIAVNGGSIEIDVSADAPFSSILVGAGPTSPSGVPTPWPGSHTVDLASPASDASVVVTVSQAPPSTEFSVVIAVVDASGAVSAIDWTNVSIVEVGTGDVQVSVSFSEDSDVDLYVVDPEGETIYFGSQSSSSGGELDLDSNPSCQIDGIRNENVTWPLGEAPSGSYEVRLNLYADCGVDQTSWVVTVQAIGRTYRWEGVLEAPGTPGGEDAGQVVARFDVP